ncbi:MAG: hypothetical protein Q4D96_06945 [Propionibacteriaceae bacterium]|nr:hypothetical protein [Propionibacteriaceae bacterium]
MSEAASVAAELEVVARGVAGVRQLYLAGSTVGAVLAEGAKMLGLGSGASTIKVQLSDDSCSIEVSCAVAAGHNAKDVTQALVEALTAACRERHLPAPRVKATIAQVTTAGPAAP